MLGRFNKLKNEKNLVKNYIKMKLIENQNLLKYIYYNTENPLQEPNIDDPFKLFNHYIYSKPKKIEVSSDSQTYLLFYFTHGRVNNKNFAYEDYYIIFDVITHDKLLENINNGYTDRCFAIMDEIESIFNGQRGKWLGKLSLASWDNIIVSDNFEGYRMIFKASSFS